MVETTVSWPCDVRQYGDMTKCAHCGLVWDTNDPDPPKCPRAGRDRQEREAEKLAELENAAFFRGMVVGGCIGGLSISITIAILFVL